MTNSVGSKNYKMWNSIGPLFGEKSSNIAVPEDLKKVRKSKSSQNGWHNIDWKKAEEKIKILQEKIVIATIKLANYSRNESPRREIERDKSAVAWAVCVERRTYSS